MKMVEYLKYSTAAVTLPYRLILIHPKRSSYDSKHNGTRMINACNILIGMGVLPGWHWV
ncbi:MAG: hypothetical protein R3B95_17955 [Nitrospirales bacterium]|nr:hypothetical protein [Nitrospirales bacterium]